MHLIDLPTKLLQQIAKNLDLSSLKDLLLALPTLTFLIPLLEAALPTTHTRKLSALHWAASKGYLHLAILLLENGTDTNARDSFNQTPLHHAVLAGDVDMTCFFLSQDSVDMNAFDDAWQTAFHCAALSGRVDLVRVFVEHGCDIDQGTYQADQTALQLAVQFGNVAVAELLLMVGADIDRRCERGKTALHWAAQGNRVFNSSLVPSISLLLDKGADVGVTDYSGNTPVHLVVGGHLEGACEAVKLLLDSGVGIDVRNRKGRTALHVAALDEVGRGKPDVMNLLLDEGADIAVRDSKGVTALQIAVSKGFRFGRRRE